MANNLPPSLERVFDQMKESANLHRAAASGDLPDEPMTREFHFTGEEPADALALAYSMRDKIRKYGYQCEAEYIGLADEEDQHESFAADRHVVEIHINHSGEANTTE